MKILSALFLGTAAFMSNNCNSDDSRVEEHERVCKAQGRTEVVDESKWAEYILGISKAQKEREKAHGTREDSLRIEHVQGFDIRFGPSAAYSRAEVGEGLKRHDTLVYSEGRLVARLIDFVDVIPRFGHSESLDCVSRFPSLYFSPEVNTDAE